MLTQALAASREPLLLALQRGAVRRHGVGCHPGAGEEAGEEARAAHRRLRRGQRAPPDGQARDVQHGLVQARPPAAPTCPRASSAACHLSGGMPASWIKRAALCRLTCGLTVVPMSLICWLCRSWGVANRGASIRVGRSVPVSKCGYYEDRRCAACLRRHSGIRVWLPRVAAR